METSDAGTALRIAAAALTAGIASWFFIDWLSNGHHRPAVVAFSQLAFLVFVPVLIAMAVTLFRPGAAEWLFTGLPAAAVMAFMFGRHAYNALSYDDSREQILSGSIYTFGVSLLTGSALVLAAYVAAHWRRLQPDER